MENKKQNEKVPYEELVNCVNAQRAQLMDAYKRLESQEFERMIQRLDILIRIIDSPSGLYSEEFLENCVKEVENAVKMPETTEEETKEKEE